MRRPEREAGARRPVVVIGGGIAGLTAAWALGRERPDLEVVVLEAATRPGGKLAPVEVAGLGVDTGPDSFLARVPAAATLCRDLGLGEQLVAPATNRALVWSRDRLRPLPAGLVLGFPSRLGPLARSGLVSPAGLARAATDLARVSRWPGPGGRRGPGRGRPVPEDTDRSVAEVALTHLGREVLERLVDPLLGGIHAGRCEELSLAAVAPEVAAAAERGGSLVRALRRRPPPIAGPVFLTLRHGLTGVVDALVAQGPPVVTGATVTAVVRAGRGYEVVVGPGEPLVADAVVVATPAPAAGRVLAALSPRASAGLAAIDYASVATVTLAYRPGDVTRALDASGFLVPRVEGQLITACTWLTAKWPHLAAGAGDPVLVRASAGRRGDGRAGDLDDAALAGAAHRELVPALGLAGTPVASRVERWPASLPQYRVGHRLRVAGIERALTADAPGVVLAGAAYRGLGVAACVADGQRAARAVAALLAPVRARGA